MREVTYQEAISEALREEMRRDQSIIVYGEDVELGYSWGVTKGLREEFGKERVMDTPLSENILVGAGVGAAMTGLRPVVEIQFSDFLTLCMDQLVNEAAKMRYMTGGQAKVPMIVRTPGGTVGGHAATHSQSLEAWFMHVPGLRVAVPGTPYDAKGLMKESLRGNDPVLFFEHQALYKLKGQIPEKEYVVPLGVADVKQEGSDITIVAYSRMLHQAVSAAQQLKAVGISAEIVDLRTLAPLDLKTVVASVRKTGRLVVVEEGVKTAGVGAEIGMLVVEEAFDYLDGPIIRVAARDVPIPLAPVLQQQVLPSDKDIVKAAKHLMGAKSEPTRNKTLLEDTHN